MNSNPSQIVITGAGLVTPLGTCRAQVWRAVTEGRCGMGPLPAIESPLPADANGGQAPDLPEDFEPHLNRETRYLRYAIFDALRDAGNPKSHGPYDPGRCGIILGTTLHGMRSAGQFLRSGNFEPLKDFLAASVLSKAAGDLNFTGCALTTCSACSSSLGAVTLAATLLRSGELDCVVAGGYDTISEYVYGGFSSLRLVAPALPRPFARGRQGMKLAEGYGIVVLERSEDAVRRGGRPLAAILGYGESADAHHLTQPHPDGEGAARAMHAALTSAGLSPRDIDLIAAHGTGTPDNDASEYAALSRVFGSSLSRVPVVAFKSHVGHTLGGAGAVELILSAMALQNQVIPPSANIAQDESEFPGLNLPTGTARPAALRATLNTSLGFGGANTCVVLGRVGRAFMTGGADIPVFGGADILVCPESASAEGTPSAERTRRKADKNVCPTGRQECLPHWQTRMSTPPRDVFITGIGVLLPDAVGNDAFARRLKSGSRLNPDQRTIPESEIAPLLSARRVRRMSEYVKLSLAAAVLCVRDAGVENIPAFADTCAAILGTTHGSTGYSEAYYQQIVKEGIAAANPMLFAEGVPNSAAAHLSLMLSLKGPCQTVIGSRTAGLDAMRLATARIAAGEWERALVGAAEEYSPLVPATYQHWGLAGEGGFVPCCGAVTMLLESRQSLESRSGRVRGRVVAAAGGMTSRANLPRLIRHMLGKLENPSAILTSANGTWIDRAERMRRICNASSPYRIAGECFSVLPLVGIAAAMLCGSLPDGTPLPPGKLGALATDYSGLAAGICIEPVALAL